MYQNHAVHFASWPRRVLIVVLAALALTACRIDADVNLSVRADGSGVITVRVGVDDDALSQDPGLIGEVRTADLQQAGWQVVGPAKGDRNLTWITMSKPFANAAQANQFLGEVTGEGGMLRGAKLTHNDPFGRVVSSFRATFEPSNGINSFVDGDLLKAIEGTRPLDAQLKKLEAQGKSLDQVMHFSVRVSLPGDDTPAVWTPKLTGAPTKLSADSTEYHYVTLGLGIAGIALLLLCGFLAVSHYLFGWGRRR